MTDLLNELIRAKAEKAGAPPEVSDAVAVLVRSTVDVRDGAVKVLDASGNVRVGNGPHYGDMSLDELVAELVISRPSLFGRAETQPQAAPEAKPEAGIVLRGNPYAPGMRNLTQIAILETREPERAAKLKAEAAAVPAFLIDYPITR